MKIATSEGYATTLLTTNFMKRAVIAVVCGLGFLLGAHAQVIVNLDLGNNAVATNAAGFTKLGTASGNYAVKNGSYYLWTNVANSGLDMTMTNIAPFGGAGALDADGFYNQSGNGAAYFTISNVPAGMEVTLYGCGDWNGAGRAAKVF